jgi:hypothetical protein
MQLGHWILDDKGEKPIRCDLMTWARWFEKSENRIIKAERVGDSRVSTIFLGIDYNFNFEDENAPPVLWETMVFNGPLDHEMDRCSGNREQAEAMHDQMVERVKAVEALNT